MQMRIPFLLVAGASFAVTLLADRRPKEPPKTYENSRALDASCDAVWSQLPAVIARRGFMPDSSDRAGGFLKLRYTRGDTGWLKSDKDVKALTAARGGFLTTYDRFRISAG